MLGPGAILHRTTSGCAVLLVYEANLNSPRFRCGTTSCRTGGYADGPVGRLSPYLDHSPMISRFLVANDVGTPPESPLRGVPLRTEAARRFSVSRRIHRSPQFSPTDARANCAECTNCHGPKRSQSYSTSFDCTANTMFAGCPRSTVPPWIRGECDPLQEEGAVPPKRKRHSNGMNICHEA